MALIGTIRKNSWIMIILVGLGMFGFLLMDMIGQNNSIGGSGTDVGSIDGRTISIQEFQNKQNELFNNSGGDANQQRSQVWNYFIQETLINNTSDALGIGVGDQEFKTLFETNSRNFSPTVINEFGGYQNFNIEQYNNIKSQLTQSTAGATDQVRAQLNQLKDYWRGLEGRAEIDHKTTKISTLVSKAIFTPTWMAEMENKAQNQKADFKFVAIPYASITEDVKVEDSDLKAYLKNNKGQFTQDEPSRTVKYVVFDVVPTSPDSAIIRNTVADLASKFAQETADSLFVLNNNGTYDPSYVKKESVSPAVADSLFSAEVGTVIGPYLDGRQYKAVKLIDRKAIVDSVKTRHILIQGGGQGKNSNITSLEMGKSLVDSLITVLNAGTTEFDSLSARFNEDLASAADGGNQGWVGTLNQYSKEYSDFILYTAEKGKYYSVPTREGLHIVQVTDTKSTGAIGVKVAYVSESVVPSDDTEKAAYTKALKFTSENRDLKTFEANAKKAGYEVVTSAGLKRNDYFLNGLGGGNSSREVVKWAFENASEGEISKDIYTYEDPVDFYESKHVVAALVSTSPAGLVSIDDVREELTELVTNEKKAELIKKKVANGSLDAIAAAFENVNVQTASQVSMRDQFVPGLGAEPKILARAFNIELNKVSQPIAGNQSVGIIEVTARPENVAPGDIASLRKTAAQNMQQRVRTSLLDALKNASDVNDKRYRFF